MWVQLARKKNRYENTERNQEIRKQILTIGKRFKELAEEGQPK
jgi:hypothetical protein